MKFFRLFVCIALFAGVACAQRNTPTDATAPAKAPFPYVWGTAFHILPETTSEESGYFSIVEGHNGKIYIGTAKYNVNAFLVEFDPQTNQQRVVVNTNKINGLTATGYAAQAKIHTRNFVGPSGKIYVGSQEGYRTIEGDNSVYPGGYVMTYDPKTGKAESLGQPFPGDGATAGKGVIDVVADEARGLLYVVTTKDLENKGKSYWVLGDIKAKTYRPFGLEVTNYAATLMDDKGRAHVITANSQIATYDPKTGKVTLRDIIINGKKWTQSSPNNVPVWRLTPDAKGAYLTFLEGDSKLHFFDLRGNGAVRGKILGTLLRGKGFDHRSSLTVAPDGRVYALLKSANETGFGNFPLHHLVRYDPKTKKTADLGVLAVKNPNFYDFSPDKQRPGAQPYTFQGYQKLPDQTLVPGSGHQGLIAGKNGDLYALLLYPYTLLKIESASPTGKPFEPQRTNAQANTPRRAMTEAASPSRQYTEFARRSTLAVEKNIPAITRVAEVIAERHLQGGLIGFPFNGQSLQQELAGRSGGLMHIGFNRPWENRDAAGDKNNVAIIGWDRASSADEVVAMQKLKDAGTYIVGFGPRDLPELAEQIKLCDAFFDTGLGADDRVVTLPNGEKAGRGNALVNMLNGWSLIGETVAALTRRGKMPPMWKAWMMPEGRPWSDKYFMKSQFHNDGEFQVAPIVAGEITRDFLQEIRANVERFETTQTAKVKQSSQLIADEFKAGRKTVVATQGHAPWTYAGKYEDAFWITHYDIDGSVPAQVAGYATSPEGALVLRLGYSGQSLETTKLFADKKQRVILITTPSPRPEFQPPADLLLNIDMGYAYGDSLVPIENYPVKIIPPSGIMQIVAYEAINTEVLGRLKK